METDMSEIHPGFPHTRGDRPSDLSLKRAGQMVPPHAWG